MIREFFRSSISDDIIKRLAHNIAYLFSANMIVAGLGMLTLIVMARSLGPTGLGILAIIEAYARSVDRLFRFEPWQTLIRYGAAALENGDETEFRRLVKFSTLFDLFGAALSATVALLGLYFVADWFDLEDENRTMAMLFAATLFFGLASTPTAILRIFNKFQFVSKLTVITASIRLLMASTVWLMSGDLWSFLYVLIIHQILEKVLLLIFAWRELYRQGHGQIWDLPFNGLLNHNTGILKFLWNVNINVIARTSTQRFDVLLLGVILGPAAVGLFQLAKRVGIAAQRLGRPLQQAVYPDISRLWARGEVSRFRWIILRVNFVMGSVALVAFLVLAFNMEFIVRLAFGDAFVPAVPIVIVQVLATTIFLTGNTMGPALMSMGEDHKLVRITLVATLFFFVAFWPLVQTFGAMGASMGHVLFNTLWLAVCLWVFLRRTHSAPKHATHTEAPDPKDSNQ
ncbi:MAG: lipopolysaccharide biosynthesis protein [Stappiaceae bacterium]